MSVRSKYGSFNITNLVFPSQESLNKYLEQFRYKQFVIKRDGKKVKKEGLLGLFYSKEQRSNFNWLKINMNVDKANNEITMDGYGHRRGVFGLEIELDDMFEDNQLVTYIRNDDCARIGDDMADVAAIVYAKQRWKEEQARRLKLFKEGKTLEEIASIIKEEREPKVYKK